MISMYDRIYSHSDNYSQQNYSNWLDAWLETTKLHVKESTYIRYRSTIENHIKPYLGNYAIKNLTLKEIENYINLQLSNGRVDKSGGLSPKTVSDQLLIIKDSLQYIQENSQSEVCNLRRISIKKVRTEMRVLTKVEEKKLLNLLFSELDLYKLGIILCLYTGIRIGELCALKWENIFLDAKYIDV